MEEGRFPLEMSPHSGLVALASLSRGQSPCLWVPTSLCLCQDKYQLPHVNKGVAMGIKGTPRLDNFLSPRKGL